MVVNHDIIETSHDIDALIRIAQVHPSERLRDKLIEVEVDHVGNHVDYAIANYIWHKLIPDAA